MEVHQMILSVPVHLSKIEGTLIRNKKITDGVNHRTSLVLQNKL